MGLEAATLSALRQRIAAIETAGEIARPAASRLVPIDRGEVDAHLGGGLACGTLHEFHPASAGDQAATNGFAALLAFASAPAKRPIVWIRQDHAAREGGELHVDGLSALGLDPARLVLVRLSHAVSVLRAGIEAARSTAIGAVLIEPFGEPKELDLTTQRRLVLAAEASGVTLFLLRPGARPMPGSAETRWEVRSAPAQPLALDAPGHPTFDLTLLRHRHGPAGGPWRLEWNRDDGRFAPPPLLRDPTALPRLRPAAPPAEGPLLQPFAGKAATDRREGQGRHAHRRAGSGGA
jgi:protein ImuA